MPLDSNAIDTPVEFQIDGITWNPIISRFREFAGSGGRLNIKMSFYQYRDPHVKDKTVSLPSYL